MEKIAIIADIHSNLHALEAVLEDMEKHSPSTVLCAGDIVGYGAYPKECITVVKKVCAKVIAGNHDVACVTGDVRYFNPYAARACLWTKNVLGKEEKEYLLSLSRRTRMGDILMVHGSPRDDDEYIYPWDVDEELVRACECKTLIMAHTHVPFVLRVSGTLVINPGSVGQPRDRNWKASYAIASLKKGEVVDALIIRVNYDVDAAYEAIIDAGLPKELGERLYYGV